MVHADGVHSLVGADGRQQGDGSGGQRLREHKEHQQDQRDPHTCDQKSVFHRDGFLSWASFTPMGERLFTRRRTGADGSDSLPGPYPEPWHRNRARVRR